MVREEQLQSLDVGVLRVIPVVEVVHMLDQVFTMALTFLPQAGNLLWLSLNIRGGPPCCVFSLNTSMPRGQYDASCERSLRSPAKTQAPLAIKTR
jgi:hypothetical protein